MIFNLKIATSEAFCWKIVEKVHFSNVKDVFFFSSFKALFRQQWFIMKYCSWNYKVVLMFYLCITFALLTYYLEVLHMFYLEVLLRTSKYFVICFFVEQKKSCGTIGSRSTTYTYQLMTSLHVKYYSKNSDKKCYFFHCLLK